jgi:hypothetical protein
VVSFLPAQPADGTNKAAAAAALATSATARRRHGKAAASEIIMVGFLQESSGEVQK